MVSYTVDSIVKEYLIEIGDSGLSRYARFYQYAISGTRQWNMDMSGVPVIAELEMDENLDVVNLPSNYLNWVKVGICADGIVYPLGENKNICLDKNYDACGAPTGCGTGDNEGVAVGDVYVSNSLSYVADHYRNGEIMGRFFGIGGGQNTNGYFRIDERSRQIKLQGLITTLRSIYLEYLADLELVDGDFQVHPFLLETLKAWIWWKSIERDKNVGLGEKQLAEQSYSKALRLSRKRLTSTSLEEWYRAIRSGNSGAVKF